jgi:hypothetical protein
MLAIRASRSPARAATMAAGSAVSLTTMVSGTGSSQVMSGSAGSGYTPGSGSGAPRPDGSIRRAGLASALRQALVAIRYSQVRIDDRPSNPS